MSTASLQVIQQDATKIEALSKVEAVIEEAISEFEQLPLILASPETEGARLPKAARFNEEARELFGLHIDDFDGEDADNMF